MTAYEVTAALKNPSAYDSGATFTIRAKNKAEAIKEARAIVRRECLYDRHDGPLRYTAELA